MLVKRCFDVAIAGVVFVVLAPIMAIVAALILVLDGRPIFFAQQRSGRDGVVFEMKKFRTMSTESEDPTTDAQRITRLGATLRSWSLDELPTLWSVLIGDMSLVGPRPLPVRYLDRYTDEQRRRLDVPPGITGLAQVRGRNLLSWEERFELDVEYAERRSLIVDLRLLVDTARSVVAREGIEAEGAVTMPEFQGSVAQ